MTKKIWIITLFPNYFDSLINFGITGSALRGERDAKIEIKTVQLRNYTPKDYKGYDLVKEGNPGLIHNFGIDGFIKKLR
jgi:tRNA (guanine37-N1)-methyltransferase